MKLIVNERDGCCESIRIEYTPTEALVINQAMRRYACDDEVNKKDRTIMEHMLDVKPIFVDKRKGEQMKDERPCDKCIFHDGTCHHWNCEPITRIEAEAAVKTLRELAKTFEPHNLVCVGDIVKGERTIHGAPDMLS